MENMKRNRQRQRAGGVWGIPKRMREELYHLNRMHTRPSVGEGEDPCANGGGGVSAVRGGDF